MQRKIIITGAPGTGKTTVLNKLIELGYECINEASREIIVESQKSGIENIFTSSPISFSNMLLKKRIAQYDFASTTNKNTVLFDRGIPDILAYLEFNKSEELDIFKKASKKYSYDKIFIFPPWKDIYTTDNERKESFNEAKKIHESLIYTYQELGYSIIEVPKDNVLNRVAFILKNIIP